ncbi:MAG: response regulator [Negativicutes bacterium]|nr:response regulator [Negativicutes bacterium]
MKILIAEDDLASRKFLFKFLSQYGDCDLTVDGLEALDAYLLSYKDRTPYDLVCLDIMMPKVDGVKVLKTIRSLEKENGIAPEDRVKVIMVTALGETEHVQRAFEIGCEAYAAKPVDTEKLVKVMEKLGLLPGSGQR